MTEERRCPQCYRFHPYPSAFMGKKGKPIQRCQTCQAVYRGWEKKTPTQKRMARRRYFVGIGASRVSLVRSSNNRKLGAIPVSMTERGSCPDACGFKNEGCYAEEHHWLKYHWGRIEQRGLAWKDFCLAISRLPRGQLWRHNEAGDLPGMNDAIDALDLASLVRANVGRRGFTFTHKPTLEGPHARRNRIAIEKANRGGFTVNLSADNLEHADALADLGIGPVAVVVPSDAGDRARRTPGGRTVIVCPAETRGLTCARCRLCSHANRKAIVAFRAHGNDAARVSETAKGKRRLPIVQLA